MFGATSPVPGSLAGRVPSCLHQEMWHAPQWQGFYSYRDIYLDLDPTYRDRFGRPLVRMTIDFHDNELKQNAFLTDRLAEVISAMGAKQASSSTARDHTTSVGVKFELSEAALARSERTQSRSQP